MLRKNRQYNQDFWICKCRMDLVGIPGYVHPNTKKTCYKCNAHKKTRPDATFAEAHSWMIIKGQVNTNSLKTTE